LPNDTPSITGLQSAWAVREAGSSNIRLVFSDQAAVCSNADLNKISPDGDHCVPGWHFAFTLSYDLLKPGIYDLHDYEANYAESVVTTTPADGCRGEPGCMGRGMGSAGGAKGPDSTIEIYSVTDECVTGRILRLERGGGSSDVDFTGGFQAVVCTPSSP
jgi:hypothetical protein